MRTAGNTTPAARNAPAPPNAPAAPSLRSLPVELRDVVFQPERLDDDVVNRQAGGERQDGAGRSAHIDAPLGRGDPAGRDALGPGRRRGDGSREDDTHAPSGVSPDVVDGAAGDETSTAHQAD